MMACGLVPSRLASLIAASLVGLLAQYRLDGDTPVPESRSVAVVPGFAPAAFSVAVAAPALAGANCTATVHDFRGPRLPLHVSLVIVNAAAPVKVTVSAPVADPPELASVNVCDAVWPG